MLTDAPSFYEPPKHSITALEWLQKEGSRNVVPLTVQTELSVSRQVSVNLRRHMYVYGWCQSGFSCLRRSYTFCVVRLGKSGVHQCPQPREVDFRRSANDTAAGGACSGPTHRPQ